jgi:hypothetical protein
MLSRPLPDPFVAEPPKTRKGQVLLDTNVISEMMRAASGSRLVSSSPRLPQRERPNLDYASPEMSRFKSLVDKMKEKSDEWQKKAAKKAAETALKQGARAATGAMDAAGKALERVIFGDAPAAKGDDDAEREREREAPAPAPPDPFAKMKAAEKAEKERAQEEKRRAKERAEKQTKIEEELDDELAALKKKLGK